MFLAIAVIIVQGIIFGIATNAIISNKGYDENWFWWGFFFGLIAVLVALSKPEYKAVYTEPENRDRQYKTTIHTPESEWTCICGRTNPGYTGTCSCGRTQEEIKKLESDKQKEKQKEEELRKNNLKLDTLMKMKQLLDSGAITEAEFAEKKKELF